MNILIIIKNQTFDYTRRITPKRVTSLWCLSTRHSAKATQLRSHQMLKRWRLKRWRTVCNAV